MKNYIFFLIYVSQPVLSSISYFFLSLFDLNGRREPLIPVGLFITALSTTIFLTQTCPDSLSQCTGQTTKAHAWLKERKGKQEVRGSVNPSSVYSVSYTLSWENTALEERKAKGTGPEPQFIYNGIIFAKRTLTSKHQDNIDYIHIYVNVGSF